MLPENVKLLEGGRGQEFEIPCHWQSPTWIVDKVYDLVKDVGRNALDAYMSYCQSYNLPHSYLLGLDILINCVVDPSGKKLVDIRPTLVEGPCCNSYPACPNFFPSRLYARYKHEGGDPDQIRWEVHPMSIRDKIVETIQSISDARGHRGKPIVGILTRPYPESEEETAHVEVLERLEEMGYRAYRITNEENPHVKNGKLMIGDVPIDICYRRIERVHMPPFYGWELAMDIVNNSPNTFYLNPWQIDNLRSKTIEERCFREWEIRTGGYVSRPKTLLGKEISPLAVRNMIMEAGGFALKKWNSSGGRGVFLHIYEPLVAEGYGKLFKRYDGRHMIIMNQENIDQHLEQFRNFEADTAIQQMRIADARHIENGRRLVYDTRINVLYNAIEKKWDFISGLSRTVPCGLDVESGNSLLTNVTAGAHLSPLMLGYSDGENLALQHGPLAKMLLAGKNEINISDLPD
ncbi:hypothetical protein ACFL27_06080 [candidate division CSSED10-310 bacterium]|uniref:Uncharacterized protein n=1 Tax=candidate division CSSED10-310 bacterium TaxID=2855610 RepID=A0ABV6YU80_UNCC1